LEGQLGAADPTLTLPNSAAITRQAFRDIRIIEVA